MGLNWAQELKKHLFLRGNRRRWLGDAWRYIFPGTFLIFLCESFFVRSIDANCISLILKLEFYTDENDNKDFVVFNLSLKYHSFESLQSVQTAYVVSER